MAIGAGLATQFGIATETTMGTQIPVTRFLDINPNDSLAMQKNPVQGQGLRAPAAGNFGSSLVERASRRVVGSWGAGGAVDFDVPFSGLGLYLEHMMGAFNPGVTGGTNNPIVTQQGVTTAWLQTYALAPLAGKTFTAQKGVPDSTGTVNPFTYPGSKITDWELTFDLNQFAKLALTIDAWQELTPANPQGTTAGQALSTAVYTASQQYFHFRQALLFNSGTLSTTGGITTLGSPVVAGRVRKGNIKLTRVLDLERKFVAGTGGSTVAGVKGEQLENGFASITGSLDVEFSGHAAYYDVAAADTAFSLWIEFVGPIIASTYAYTLGVLIPNCHYNAPYTPLANTAGIINHTVPFVGLDDEANNQLQIQYQSTDTAP